MIKLTYCLRRLPHLTRAEFQAYWLETHAPLVKAHARALGIARYVQSHAVPQSADFPLATARKSAGQDYDGVAELWWTDLATFAAAGATAEGRAAGQLLLEDEAKFIDLPGSPIFVVEEHEIVG